MAAVIAHFSLPAVWQEPKASKKAFIRWSHTCKAFGVRDLCLINVDGLDVAFGDTELSLKSAETLDEALSFYPDLTPVYVEQGGVDVGEFEWPENPVFIYGDDFGVLPKSDLSVATLNPLNAEITNGIILSMWRQHGS